MYLGHIGTVTFVVWAVLIDLQMQPDGVAEILNWILILLNKNIEEHVYNKL